MSIYKENKNTFANNAERNYNIITCLPYKSMERVTSKLPRLGNMKNDQFSSTNNIRQLPMIEPDKDKKHLEIIQMQKTEEIKNLMNSSSLNYDFISYTHKMNPETISSLRTRGGIMTNKKKSIAEFADLGRLMCPNFNPEFQETLKERPNAFRRPKGMCSYLCETEKGYGRKQFRKFKY